MSDRKIAFWFIALLSVLVLVPFLGETIFYSKGEPREAIVAYTMLESGNWILPTNYGVEIAYKPPFLYWTIAVISSVLGGVTEFSARMPSALAFLAMQLVFFSFVAKRKDVKTAFLTSILLLSSFEVHRAAVACRLDMLQVSLIVISLCLLFRWDEKNCKGIPWLAVLLMACYIDKRAGRLYLSLSGYRGVSAVARAFVRKNFLFTAGHRVAVPHSFGHLVLGSLSARRRGVCQFDAGRKYRTFLPENVLCIARESVVV